MYQADLLHENNSLPEAATACAAAAEHAAPGWTDRALACLRRYAANVPHAFTAEDYRLFAARSGLDMPRDLRAFGPVIHRALHLGVIVRTGRFAPAASSHGSPKPTYRAWPQQGRAAA